MGPNAVSICSDGQSKMGARLAELASFEPIFLFVPLARVVCGHSAGSLEFEWELFPLEFEVQLQFQARRLAAPLPAAVRASGKFKEWILCQRAPAALRLGPTANGAHSSGELASGGLANGELASQTVWPRLARSLTRPASWRPKLAGKWT